VNERLIHVLIRAYFRHTGILDQHAAGREARQQYSREQREHQYALHTTLTLPFPYASPILRYYSTFGRKLQQKYARFRILKQIFVAISSQFWVLSALEGKGRPRMHAHPGPYERLLFVRWTRTGAAFVRGPGPRPGRPPRRWSRRRHRPGLPAPAASSPGRRPSRSSWPRRLRDPSQAPHSR